MLALSPQEGTQWGQALLPTVPSTAQAQPWAPLLSPAWPPWLSHEEGSPILPSLGFLACDSNGCGVVPGFLCIFPDQAPTPAPALYQCLNLWDWNFARAPLFLLMACRDLPSAADTSVAGPCAHTAPCGPWDMVGGFPVLCPPAGQATSPAMTRGPVDQQVSTPAAHPWLGKLGGVSCTVRQRSPACRRPSCPR